MDETKTFTLTYREALRLGVALDSELTMLRRYNGLSEHNDPDGVYALTLALANRAWATYASFHPED